MAKQIAVLPTMVAKARTMLSDDTFVQANPLGVFRTQVGSPVHAAIVAIGDGCTVAEYRERMAKGYEASGAKPAHMLYPGGSNATRVLQHCIDRIGKVVVAAKPARKAVKKPATRKATKVATPATASEPSEPSEPSAS